MYILQVNTGQSNRFLQKKKKKPGTIKIPGSFGMHMRPDRNRPVGPMGEGEEEGGCCAVEGGDLVSPFFLMVFSSILQKWAKSFVFVRSV